MAKEITVNTGTLKNDIDKLQETLNNITGSLDKMYDAVSTLDGMWDGPANVTYVQQFNKDKASMADVCKTVQAVINDMKYAKSEYDKCENEVNTIVSSIKI